MNRLVFLLVVAFAVIMPLQAAQAQFGILFCFTVDQSGYRMSGTMYGTDIASGTGTTAAPFSWSATATRGTTSAEIRHHSFTFMNPDIDGSSGCSGGNGFVDWLTYNGRITGGNGTNGYTWAGDFRNSCGSEGARTGVITLGSCPPFRAPDSVLADDETRPPAEAMSSEGTPVRSEETLEHVSLTSAPNPFAGGAVITYVLPEATDVRLVVYDLLGREVAVLVDDSREAGTHYVDFDGASLPAGTYLYRIEAGGHTEAKQMVLVR